MTGAARARLVLLLCVCTFIAVPATGTVTELPLSGAPKCRIFPKNNVWNKRVDKLPKKKNSDAIIESIGLDEGIHPDFGSGKWNGGPIGIPYTIVGSKQRSRA
jgi:hypothetical protein